MGAPTPVNTVWLSRSSRAPITASSSLAVTAGVGLMRDGASSRRQRSWTISPERDWRRLRGRASSRLRRSSDELARAGARGVEGGLAEAREVLGVDRRAVNELLEVPAHALHAVGLDPDHVRGEMR